MDQPTINLFQGRIAVFGGDARQARRFKHLDGVICYPAAGCGGSRHAQRLADSIRHGGVDRVFILVRWNSHSGTRLIRDVARAHGVPVMLLAGTRTPGSGRSK